MRACILGVVPGDIVEDAIAQCEKTLREGNKKKPLQDRVRFMLKSFADIGVKQDMIEARLNHGIDLITEDELIEINNIGRSIKDNMSGREEWFDVGASKLKDKLKPNGKKKAAADKDPYEAKEKPEPEEKEETTSDLEEAAIRNSFKNLARLQFKKYVKAEKDNIPTYPPVIRGEIYARWQEFFPNDPYPLADKEVTEEPPVKAPEDTGIETELMLQLVDGAKLTDSGISVNCPNANPGVHILRNKCEGIGLEPCPNRVGCPTWSAWDNRSNLG